MKGASKALLIARRELTSAFASPIAWIVLVLFLVVQGVSFTSLLEVVADPRAPSPYGAVLRTHFGGTFLYWAFLFFVTAVITMRLLAEERQRGTFEPLMTAPVGEGAVVCGKWLGALGFYATLWAPTLVYPLLLGRLAPPGAGPDGGPIATAYLGVLMSGAAFLALGLWASAATANQIVAAVVTFVGLMALFLFGAVGDLAPRAVAGGGVVAVLAEAVDLRAHLDAFARGLVPLPSVVFFAGLSALGLGGAVVAARAGRRPRAEMRRGAVGVILLLAALVLAGIVAARHPVRADLTAGGLYTLADRTKQILDSVDEPVEVLVVEPGMGELDDLYDEVDVLLGAMAARQPLLRLERLDPALDPERAVALAQSYTLDPEELAGGGAVLFVTDKRRRAVALLDMADFVAADGKGRLLRFDAQSRLATALLEVTDDARPAVCFTTGHGELGPGDPSVTRVLSALAADHVAVREVRLTGSVPAACQVVAAFAPAAPFSADEEMALTRFLEGGGALFLVAGDAPATGLATLLGSYGVRLRDAVVEDPLPTGIPGTWTTLLGYGRHPISDPYRGRRATFWTRPRWVEITADAEAETLVASSPAARLSPPHEAAPPYTVAAASERTGRLVVLGSAASFTDEIVARGAGTNEAFFASCVAWLSRRTHLVTLGDALPEQLAVVMTPGERNGVFVLCVAGIPGVFALAGGVLLWRRRRS